MIPHTELARLEGLSDGQLYLLLGQTALPRLSGASEPSEEELIQRARRYFDQRRSELKIILCAPEFRARFEGEKGDRAELYAAIFDAVSSIFTGIAVGVIMVLIAREGLRTFCKH